MGWRVPGSRRSDLALDALEQAKEEIESWRTDYNEQRPHSALGYIPPAQYVANLIEWAAA